MDKTLLQEYVDILETTSYPKDFKKTFKDFIEKYDGTETKELHAFLMTLVSLLAEMEDTKEKAKAYDEIIKLDEELQSKVKKLAEDTEGGEEGVFAPPIPT